MTPDCADDRPDADTTHRLLVRQYGPVRSSPVQSRTYGDNQSYCYGAVLANRAVPRCLERAKGDCAPRTTAGSCAPEKARRHERRGALQGPARTARLESCSSCGCLQGLRRVPITPNDVFVDFVIHTTNTMFAVQAAAIATLRCSTGPLVLRMPALGHISAPQASPRPHQAPALPAAAALWCP